MTGYFGELGEEDYLTSMMKGPHPRPIPAAEKYFPKGYSSLLPGIMLISNIRENGEPIGALPDGEMMFHHDMIHPRKAEQGDDALLRRDADHGGNTLFASGYAAYETLDPQSRDRLEGRKARCTTTITVQSSSGATAAARKRSTNAVHPVLRTHEETGRKAVYVNRLMTIAVLDMGRKESERAAQRAVRSRREAGIRLRACLAAGRSAAVGQSLLAPCAHRISDERAPADAAHQRQGHGAAVLSKQCEVRSCKPQAVTLRR